MSRHGISFGSHSCTHRILTTLTRDDIESELRRSQCALRDHDVNHIPVFSYPNGDYTPDIARLVRAAGYEAAVTVRAGFEDAAPPDLFGLRRIGIHNDATSTMPLFTLQLSGLTRQRWSTS
jgi:peptidoglycan/xylan/chitin deacetylase (PgdA/CDA1 family)